MKRKILTLTILSSAIFSRLSAIINAVFTKGYKKHYNRNLIKVNSIAAPFLIGLFKFDSHTILILLLCVVFVLAFVIIVFSLSFIRRRKRLKTNGELTQGNNTQCLEKKDKTSKKYKQFPLIRLASLIIPFTVLAVIFAARLDTEYSKTDRKSVV